MSVLHVRRISAEQHEDFLADQPHARVLQTPTWRPLKAEWQRESIGWFADDRPDPVGVGLVLRRPVPRLDRYFLAYLPQGPVIDWSDPDLARWLGPMATYLRSQGAFGIRMGPPVLARRWSAERVKEGLADPGVRRFADLTPSSAEPGAAALVAHLDRSGWRSQETQDGWGTGQPQYTFEVPLTGEAEALSGMNRLWQRNIRRAEKAGVTVTILGVQDGAEALSAALTRFHGLYSETAQRDGFDARPLDYFQRMFEVASDEHPDRLRLFLITHGTDLVAAGILVRFGARAWASYGASSTDHREVRGSNAMHWAMLRTGLAEGAEVYDLGGIAPGLDDGDDHVGLVRFKVGTGGEAHESVGEWDLPLRRALYAAFDLYTRRVG